MLLKIRGSKEDSIKNLFWYSYNYDYEAGRSQDIDVIDAILELQRKYGETAQKDENERHIQTNSC